MSQYVSNSPNFGGGPFGPLVDCVTSSECRVRVASHARSAVEIAVNGVHSFFEDMWLGGQRTSELLDSPVEIVYESWRIVVQIVNAIRRGLSAENAPLYLLIYAIVKKIISHLSDEDQERLARKVGEKIGVSLAEKVAKKITKNLAIKVAASALFKHAARGVLGSLVASRTAPHVAKFVLGLSVQGLLQRASRGAARLQAKTPTVFDILAKQELQFLYFLVEEVLDPYVTLISEAEKLAKVGKHLYIDVKYLIDLIDWEVSHGW